MELLIELIDSKINSIAHGGNVSPNGLAKGAAPSIASRHWETDKLEVLRTLLYLIKCQPRRLRFNDDPIVE